MKLGILTVFFSILVADFSGNEFVILRKNVSQQDDNKNLIQTDRRNKLQLNNPQFIGALSSEKVSLFFLIQFYAKIRLI